MSQNSALAAPTPGSFVTLPEIAQLAFSLPVTDPSEVFQLSFFVASSDYFAGSSARCRGELQVLSGPNGPYHAGFIFPAAWYAGANPMNPASATYVITGWPAGTYYGHFVYPSECLAVWQGYGQVLVVRIQ